MSTRIANDENDGTVGGVVEAGLEYGFAPNWCAGIEYDYMFLPGRSITLTTTPCATVFRNDHVAQGVDMGLVRLNYKFGGPGIAKY